MAVKISCFEMKNFRALNTLTIYLNISKIKVLIQIILYRNARIQLDLSKNNKRKKVPVCEMLEFCRSLSSSMLLILSWKLKITAYRSSSTFPPSSKLELLCQYETTFIIPESSIIDDLGVLDPPLVSLFSVQTLPKRLELNEVDIYMFKVKKKGTKTMCEICCIHFHICTSSHPEVFFKKGAL